MKPIAVFVLVAVFSVATLAAQAKVTNTHQDSANTQSVVGVAGPAPKPVANDQGTAQPSKKQLKKSRVKAKPGLNDPN